ncbi:DUF1156 domain-containing protein [Staphylospora marina]|uniref:DUF1156 domain-containing protein n=1 Tax=Staphylospora marina TaxID=2490858 RepID=UPI000F5BDBA8|nr:DUF1156 domain-containing protein [Staphylospora marina]
MATRKKLIEVSIPLDVISAESAREKSIRHGHPSTLHLWWARRPLAAARAVLFASLVDDPSNDLPEEEANKERDRLLKLLERLIKWESSNDEQVLNEARLEIAKSIAKNKNLDLPQNPVTEDLIRFLSEHAPPILDPFAGGGTIPLEAHRLGLRAFAGDLNPVAVTINKALIEIPPRFAGFSPVNPKDRGLVNECVWKYAYGLARDIEYYGNWMKREAEKRIGHLYPKVKLPKEMGSKETTVIAWLWTRTVTCPNPACGAEMPLIRSFWLSKKKNKEAWVEPIVDQSGEQPKVRFEVRYGKGSVPDGTVDRRGAKCICCQTPVPLTYIRSEGQAGRMGQRLMAIVAEGKNGRIYLSPDETHEQVAANACPVWAPETDLPEKALGFRVQQYGMVQHKDLFTSRQLTALSTIGMLIEEVREMIQIHAKHAGLADDGVPLRDGGSGALAYAEAVMVYLALAADRCADYWSTISSWVTDRETIGHTFTRQAIPMVWDFAEANVFSQSSGNWQGAVEWVIRVVERLGFSTPGVADQRDAASGIIDVHSLVISTDPPYYDNIGYADLSDFFYVWLRRNIRSIYPELFSTMLVPKMEELVATPHRFEGNKEAAKQHFEKGLQQAFEQLISKTDSEYPLTVYYAFKQQEDDQDKNGVSTASTGWETMLTGLLHAGYQITGTWPIRTERSTRSVAIGTNALASSIVLVCRPRPLNAPLTTRREFMNALRKELPEALKLLQEANIAPVDMAQSMIGPGMAVFSRYAQVLESDGTPMSVRTALALINQVLEELLSADEGEYDLDTRWALSWFEQFGMKEALFGEAELLSKAKNTSVSGLVEAGIIEARAGKVRLLTREEYPEQWDPTEDNRFTLWEATQYIIRAFEREGELGAARLIKRLGDRANHVRDLAYRLYSICEKKGWAQEAIPYNMLAASWSRLKQVASGMKEYEMGRLV